MAIVRAVRVLAVVLAAVLIVGACGDDTEPAARDLESYKAALIANGYGDRFESDLEIEEFLNSFCDVYEEHGIEMPLNDDVDRLTTQYCNDVHGGPLEEPAGGDPIP